jgi:uncharacterized membrane protein
MGDNHQTWLAAINIDEVPMPHFESYSLIKWLHLVSIAMGRGSAMVVLVLAGLEDTREDLKGLTSVLWRRTTAWAFRLAVLLGIVLLVLRFHMGDQPFAARYLHLKLVLVALMLVCSELSGKALGRSRRGAAMLAFLFFLMATFVQVNGNAFGTFGSLGANAAGHYSGAVQSAP